MAPVHRWSGRVAVALTVPVAVHCLYALAFRATAVGVSCIRSSAASFSAPVSKMLILTREDSPGWALPASVEQCSAA